MKSLKLIVLLGSVLALAGCVTRTHQENSALRMGWVKPPIYSPSGLPEAAGAYPSVGGDILKGTSPAELAEARAAASRALTTALAKP